GEYTFSIPGDFADLAGNVGSDTDSDTWLANDASRIKLGGATGFLENSRPVGITGGAVVTDADTPFFAGGQLTVTIADGANAADRLGLLNRGGVLVSGTTIRVDGTTIGTVSGGVGVAPMVIDFNSDAALAAVDKVVKAVSFQTLGDNPS